MLKRFKIKLYPTIKQKEMLDMHFDAYRFCYNLSLEYSTTLWRDYKKNISGYTLQSEILELRKQTPWLKKCKAECVRDAGKLVEKNLKHFFNGKGYPKFKKKHGIQSFKAQQCLTFKDNKLIFFSNKIKIRDSVKYKTILSNNKIKNIVFKKDLCGDYWATCLIEIKHDIKSEKLPETVVGLDLGIKNLIVTSENTFYENKKIFIKTENKLKRLNRKLLKSKNLSKNRVVIRFKIAKINIKSKRQKEHYYHQITNKLISDNQTIVVENLNIKSMKKNRKLSKHISDASWGLILTQLTYKCDWNKRKFIKIDRWFPSSKTCSGCGNIKDDLLLKERNYICECCGLSIDRDLNAAINIRNAGLKIPEVPMEDTKCGSYEVGSKSIIINN